MRAADASELAARTGARLPAGRVLPREHGAWVQLGLPLVGAVWLSAASGPAWLLAGAAALAFLAHEPAAVALGLRGRRLRREHGGAAGGLAAALALGALGLGAGGLLRAGPAALWWSAPALALLGLLLPAIARRRERSLGAELIAAPMLVAMSLPVLAAAGWPAPVLAGWGLVWAAGFCLATLAVHGAKARALAGRSEPAAVAAGAGLAGLGLAVAVDRAGLLPMPLALALAPMALAALAVALVPLRPRQMTRAGIGLAVAGTLTLLTLVAVVP
ncbi:MAG: YwiC-like family protein [Deltaproteobacteria bacterium]|nr:YwiC-like family protein [Deltaproteobacteria bacterium]